ncbi:MAG: hypothetical protein AAGI44_17865, partial [Pseudomonadota bacterium]
MSYSCESSFKSYTHHFEIQDNSGNAMTLKGIGVTCEKLSLLSQSLGSKINLNLSRDSHIVYSI